MPTNPLTPSTPRPAASASASTRTTTGTTTSLALREVTKTYDHRVVLDHLTASITPGAVTGVIGENGCGKSTLLRLLAGVEEPDTGRVVAVASAGLAHLPQEPAAPPAWTVQRVVDEALADVRRLERRLHELEAAMAHADGGQHPLDALLAEYGEVSTAFELRDGFSADARVERALAGLGLAGLPRGRRLGELSGGQRSRLHLAALLAADAEVLLLDEPTNHLDDTAAGWLAGASPAFPARHHRRRQPRPGVPGPHGRRAHRGRRRPRGPLPRRLRRLPRREGRRARPRRAGARRVGGGGAAAAHHR
ncbi:ATP-binding cassette domain-containing protein [Paenibacillus sp. TRM 82003]|nr:ATP-binding cassette domain-containing protein [Kineococcus sp. TRM81007]MCI2238200.1 ATP-binding cassette domain-containing protein [Kineococcus sp. TRM81007]MCI3924541.1 ATP-binding cassette domain-containing protein [Paenibacillus sp. TRM 82003]